MELVGIPEWQKFTSEKKYWYYLCHNDFSFSDGCWKREHCRSFLFFRKKKKKKQQTCYYINTAVSLLLIFQDKGSWKHKWKMWCPSSLFLTILSQIETRKAKKPPVILIPLLEILEWKMELCKSAAVSLWWSVPFRFVAWLLCLNNRPSLDSPLMRYYLQCHSDMKHRAASVTPQLPRSSVQCSLLSLPAAPYIPKEFVEVDHFDIWGWS